MESSQATKMTFNDPMESSLQVLYSNVLVHRPIEAPMNPNAMVPVDACGKDVPVSLPGSLQPAQPLEKPQLYNGMESSLMPGAGSSL